jgi:hypothetical protein
VAYLNEIEVRRDAGAAAARAHAGGEALRDTVAGLRAENQLLRERLASVAQHAETQHHQLQHARVRRLPYCDEKVANRDIRVWHLVIENGY